MKTNCFCLSGKELDMIHETSLKFLKKHGIRFLIPEAVEIFAEAGFNTEGDIVKFSTQEIENAIKKAPSQLIRHGAEESLDVKMGNGDAYLGGGSLPIYIVEAENNRRRRELWRSTTGFPNLRSRGESEKEIKGKGLK